MVNITEIVKDLQSCNPYRIIVSLMVSEHYCFFWTFDRRYVKNIPEMNIYNTVFGFIFIDGIPGVFRHDGGKMPQRDIFSDFLFGSLPDEHFYHVDMSLYRTKEDNEALDAYRRKCRELEEERSKMTDEEFDAAWDKWLEEKDREDELHPRRKHVFYANRTDDPPEP